MCLALPNSYAQGAEVIAWTRMVIHFYCSVLAESVVFWPGRFGVYTPHPGLSLA